MYKERNFIIVLKDKVLEMENSCSQLDHPPPPRPTISKQDLVIYQVNERKLGRGVTGMVDLFFFFFFYFLACFGPQLVWCSNPDSCMQKHVLKPIDLYLDCATFYLTCFPQSASELERPEVQ